MKTWYVSNTGNPQGLVIEETTGRNVAATYDKTDATLIAAAPELLAALRLCVDALTPSRNGEEQSAADAARTAITKAEGKS